MVAQQQTICLARVTNYDKEMKKIEKEYTHAQKTAKGEKEFNIK